MRLAVSEVFYSIQGEGKTAGMPAVFVRLGGCNLMCGGQGTQFDKDLHNGATWRCDTVEVWMRAISKPIEEILDKECEAAVRNGARIILTGGEPLLQQTSLIAFMNYVKQEISTRVEFEIETNGTVMPSDELDKFNPQYNCSPKLSNSGNDKLVRFNKLVLEALVKRDTQFKIVIANEADFTEAIDTFAPIVGTSRMVLMPAGENNAQLEATRPVVAELCKRNYINFSDRMHISIWDKKTGV